MPKHFLSMGEGGNNEQGTRLGKSINLLCERMKLALQFGYNAPNGNVDVSHMSLLLNKSAIKSSS